MERAALLWWAPGGT